MDSKRAKQIINAQESIEVLYEGSPVWLESVKINNVAEVTRIDRNERIDVPVYLLVENNPVKT